MEMNKIIVLLLCLGISLNSLSENLPEGIKVQKIWDAAGHNAFTDLIKFKGNYYCSFREGENHVYGKDGEVRILKSKDCKNWESVALLKKEGIDLRDPKLSVTPDGRIMVIIGGSKYQGKTQLGRTPHVAFSDKAGKQFSESEKVTVDPEIASWGDWIWRVAWHKGVGYGIDYQIGPKERKGPTSVFLVKTTDGKYFEKVSKLELDGFPNESTIRFDKEGTMYVLVRRELEDKMGVLAHSKAPYTQWEYAKLNYQLGGPNFVFTDDEQIIMGSRVYESDIYTGLLWGNKNGTFRKILRLPSGGYEHRGDNSYPGLLLEKDRLLMSYYSSHEGKASIYIAEIPLSYFEEMNQTPPVLESTKIWGSEGKHCAFTDIIRFNDKFFCTFREATGHVPGLNGEDGKIRVLVSDDGEDWKSAALISEDGIDLRDPKLSVMPNGKLMITCGGSDYNGNDLMEWHTRVIYSENGTDWTQAFRVRGIPTNNWFFRPTWFGDTGYVAANICSADPETGFVRYRNNTGFARQLVIYKTQDGMNYEKVSDNIAPDSLACEATIRFKSDSSMVIIVRNAGGKSSRWSYLMKSQPPYTEYSSIKVDHGLGGPNIIPLENDKWLLATREYSFERPGSREKTSAVLMELDENGIYKRLFELPAGGDCSYPGFLIYQDKLWVSYYSSHEGSSAIYLTSVPLQKIKTN